MAADSGLTMNSYLSWRIRVQIVQLAYWHFGYPALVTALPKAEIPLPVALRAECGHGFSVACRAAQAQILGYGSPGA
jgi:hypothetical protein